MHHDRGTRASVSRASSMTRFSWSLVTPSRASSVSSVASLRRSSSVGSRQGFFILPSWLVEHAVYSRHGDNGGSKPGRFLDLSLRTSGQLSWRITRGHSQSAQASCGSNARFIPGIAENSVWRRLIQHLHCLLWAGEGGFMVWGKLMPAEDSLRLGGLPIGLAHHLRLAHPVKAGRFAGAMSRWRRRATRCASAARWSRPSRGWPLRRCSAIAPAQLAD